jgi:hypothetical protein
MVSLDRSEFVAGLSTDPVVQAFARYFFFDLIPPEVVDTGGERGRITVAALRSLASTDGASFNRCYDEMQRRQINEESDWIFDNYLSFILAVGVRRFGKDSEFLRRAFEMRRHVQPEIESDVVADLLTLSTANAPVLPNSPLLVVGLYVADALVAEEDALKQAYQRAATILGLKESSEFVRILCVRAVDLVIGCSSLILTVPSLFWRECNRRLIRVAKAIHTFVSVIFLAAWFALVFTYLRHDSGALEKLFNAGLIVFPAGFIFIRKKFVDLAHGFMLRLIGGPLIHRQ